MWFKLQHHSSTLPAGEYQSAGYDWSLKHLFLNYFVYILGVLDFKNTSRYINMAYAIHMGFWHAHTIIY